MAKWIFALALLFVFSPTARAEGIQAQCGAEEGMAFSVAGGLIPSDQAGWYRDHTTGETVIRIDLDTGAVDVRYKDATGIWQSIEDQGGSAALFGANAEVGSFIVVVAYPGTAIEILTLAEIDDTSATLIHTLSRSLPAMTNSRVMTGSCVLTVF